MWEQILNVLDQEWQNTRLDRGEFIDMGNTLL